MVYDHWMTYLDKHVNVLEYSPATASDSGQSTSQPQQSLNSNQYGDITSFVTAHPATYRDTTTINYPPYDPDFSQSSLSGFLPFETVHPYGSSAAGERDNVSSTYPSYNYPPVPNLGLSGTNPANSLPIASIQPPNDEAYHQFQLQEEDPVNDHQSGSNALDGAYVCKWHDGHPSRSCDRTEDKDKVAQHMKKYHFDSPEPAKNPFKCRWEDCRRLEPFRRDTINRHIQEVHLGKRRSKLKARTINSPHQSRNKAHTI